MDDGSSHVLHADPMMGHAGSPNAIMWSRLCLLKTFRPVKLSDFHRVCVGNRTILLQMNFCVGAAAPLGYRLRGRTAIRCSPAPAVEAHGKQDRGNAAEGRDAGDGGSRDPSGRPAA